MNEDEPLKSESHCDAQQFEDFLDNPIEGLLYFLSTLKPRDGGSWARQDLYD